MRFSIAATLAFATSVVAQTAGFNVMTKPTQGEEVPAGSTYEIVWQHGAEHPGPVTIELIGGPTQPEQIILKTLVSGYDASAESYSWSVDSDLGDLAVYGLKLSLDSDPTIFQYSFPFRIESDDESGEDTTSSEVETSTKSSTKTATVTSATTTTFSVPSSTLVSSTTVHGNLSTTAGHQTTITSVVTTGATPTQTSTSSIATNGVASLAAGSFAMLGGVAMAVLAL
jgi:hypothetical protein